MNIVVTGGRAFTDACRVFQALDSLHQMHPITHLLHGDARGADRLCQAWAISRRIPNQAMPADWARHGRSAGPIRNTAMANTSPDILVAFPGGVGTAHMREECRKRGIQIWHG